MGLKDVLQKMKLVEAEAAPPERAPSRGPAPPPAPAAPAKTGGDAAPRRAAVTSRETLEEMLESLPTSPEMGERILPHADLSDDEEPDFGAIYRAAGVPEPPHGFTALKVLEMLGSDHLRALDASARASAILGFLQMNPTGVVAIRDVIQDAVLRDQALDACEDALRHRWAAQAQEIDKQNAGLQAEIDALIQRNRARIESNRAQLETQRQQLARWQARKRIEERRLFDAVSPFVEANPVTTVARESAPAEGDAPPNPGPAQT